jgi:hypothetical protein
LFFWFWVFQIFCSGAMFSLHLLSSFLGFSSSTP